MKIVINIPEEVYKRMTNGDLPIYMAYKYVKNGTPLDDIKADIESAKYLKYGQQYGAKNCLASGLDKALEIIDKHIGKESNAN